MRRRGRRARAPGCRGRAAGLLVAGLVLAAAGCGVGEGGSGSPAGDVPEEDRYGGTAVVAATGDVPTVNPFALNDYLGSQLARYALFTPLVQLDRELRPRPRLARSWDMNEDTTRVTVRLRDDLRWHDGESVTAEDVAFTFRRVKDPDVGSPAQPYFSAWDSVEVVDPHTLRFRVRPVAALFFGWTLVPIAPEHVLGGVPPSELAGHPFGSTSPVGSGPYRLVRREPGDRWVLEANPDFPEALGGRPYLDRLVYRVVPDESTLLAELRSGRVDFYVKMLPSQAEEVSTADELRLATFPFPSYSFVVWNGRRSPFRDATVRRALTMAIDRGTIVEAALEGFARPATGPVGPWHWAFDTAWRPLPFDPDSARALLEAAGWTDADADGVRERSGEAFRFELLTPDNRLRRDIAVMMQAQLSDVGVAAEPRVRDYPSLAAALTGPERDFDAGLLAIQPDLVVDQRALWACDRTDHPFHMSGWCDPALDAVMDSMVHVRERDRRRRLLRRFNELVHRAQPFTFRYFEARVDGLRERLRGVEMDPRGELISVETWWIHPDGR